jgi:Acetyltransferase (GNAT) family
VLVRFDQVARFIANPNHRAVERIEIRQSRARGVRKTAPLRNKNTATAPVHSQKPKCQNTERRSALRIGAAQEGSSRARSNKDSLKKIPTSGNSGTAALRVHDLKGREDLTPWLGGVFVGSHFRRQGIGAALCAAVEDKARLRGIQTLYLFTLDKQAWY